MSLLGNDVLLGGLYLLIGIALLAFAFYLAPERSAKFR
jgi:hypothetical protein